MSRFRNDNEHALSFEFGGKRHDVEPGGEISIAPKLAFAVLKMGLPLTAVDSDEDELAQAASDERPVEPTALLWHGRAVEQRRLLVATQGQLTTVEQRLAAADEEISRQSSALLTLGESLATALVTSGQFERERNTLKDELATVIAEKSALLVKATALEEAATAPAETTSAPAGKKGKGTPPAPTDVTPTP